MNQNTKILKRVPIFGEKCAWPLIQDQKPRVCNFSGQLQENACLKTEMPSRQQARFLKRCHGSEVMKDLMSHIGTHMQGAGITGAVGALTLHF